MLTFRKIELKSISQNDFQSKIVVLVVKKRGAAAPSAPPLNPPMIIVEHILSGYPSGNGRWPVADPDLELRRGGGGHGFVLLTLLAFISSMIFFVFIQNRGGWPPGPSPRSATGGCLLRVGVP